MKNFLILIVIFIFLIFGCVKEGLPITVSQSGKDDFEVVFLFEKDGIRVYRFRDAGYYRYFTIGNGSFQPQTQNRVNGKIKSSFVDGAYNN